MPSLTPPATPAQRRKAPPQPLVDRLAARVVTGPAGHLYGGVVDWVVLLVRWGLASARGRRLGG